MKEVDYISDLYFDKVIHLFLPNAIPGSWSQTGENISLKFHEFKLFNGSKFEAASISDFIHFTSVSNLISIIKSKSILFSDLNLFNDQNELLLANRNLVDFWKDPCFYDLKSQLFAFSLCPLSDETKNSKKMWNSYGRNGKGACIHFSIDRNLLFHNYFFGKIQYHPDIPIQELVSLRQRHENFNKTHKIQIVNFPETLGVVSSFYKETGFEDENEIRLLKYIFKPPEDPHFYSESGNIILCFDDDLGKIKYRLRVKLEDESCGNITIKSIYLKEEINEPNLTQIYQYIIDIFSQTFNKPIDIQFLS